MLKMICKTLIRNAYEPLVKTLPADPRLVPGNQQYGFAFRIESKCDAPCAVIRTAA